MEFLYNKTMEQKQFEKLKHIIHKESGIYLGPDKITLLANRLRKRMRALSLSNTEEYLEIIETDASGEELVALIDVVSTNHTFFYRERQHFDFLKKSLIERSPKASSDIKLWCAASSSGEEPYSLAITLSEAMKARKGSFKILATDICTRVLREASDGVYQLDQLNELSPAELKEYFIPLTNNFFKVNSSLRQSILFKRMNLSQFPYPLKGNFDYIFCRNVMIYFRDDLKEQIIERFTKLLKPGGYLVLGNSESIARLKHDLKTVGTSIYQKQER